MKNKIVVFFIAFAMLMGMNSTNSYSFASDGSKVLKTVYTFDKKLSNIIWDGKQYVGIGDSYAYTSSDGLNWNKHQLNSLEPYQIASNGSIIAVSGGFSNSKLTLGMSKNGTDWVTISGGQVSWAPPTKMIYYKNQFFVFVNSDVYVSSDGVNYVKKKVGVSDPNKLTPKDYLYLEEKGGYCSVNPSTVVSDGKYLYSSQSDYFGVSILRSSDGIKWEIVYFNKDKHLHSEYTQFVIGNGKYLITCAKNKVLVSSNGKDWTLQDFARGDMSRVLGQSDFEYIPPRVYNFNGTYFVQCYYTKDKIDISNDYKKFYEYSVDREISDILFVDGKFIMTKEAVIDYSAAKSDISNGFKNATESPKKKVPVSKESAPSTTVKANITISKVKEFKFPHYLNAVIWDGSKYIATGGSSPGYTYTSNDGKNWKITELGIYTPRDIAYNGSVYTITGGTISVIRE